MDLLRASLKALFYDYPVDRVVGMIGKGTDTLLGIFPRLANARERSYTQASMEELHQKLRTEWLGCNDRSSTTDEVHHALKLPYLYADKVLEYDHRNHQTSVNVDELLRYAEMARYVGEDLLVVGFLAQKDLEGNHVRTKYTWDAVLPHNWNTLYQAMRTRERGLCDIHFHLQASTNVFDLNWICLMNHILNRKEQFGMLEHPLDPPVIVAKYYNYDDLYQWCILAALIRWELYKKYIQQDAGAFNEAFDTLFEKLIREKDYHSKHEIHVLDFKTREEGKSSLRAADGEIVDYAIREDAARLDDTSLPFMILHGERRLLYLFYKDYFENMASGRECMYVYLYLLAKNQLRREMMHVNGLAGLDCFKEYNHRKTYFMVDRTVDASFVGENLMDVAERYAVQTGMPEPNDGLEVRIMPTVIAGYRKIEARDFMKPIFSAGGGASGHDGGRGPTFVVHFSKAKDGKSNRHSKVRKAVHDQAEELMTYLDSVHQAGKKSKIVGFDVAGSEMNARPEVFAHLCRYCRRRGIRQFTYHVGEDFYDLVDGIRAIEEAVRFFRMDKSCRLGHCLALGMDAKSYYRSRHQTVIMPKQILLDNIVWILKFAEKHGIDMSNSLRLRLTAQAKQLYREIGYSADYNIDTYYRSMLLRGDEVKDFELASAVWNNTKEDDDVEQEVRDDADAVRLKNEYFTDNNIYRKSFLRKEEFKVPAGFAKLVKKVQQKMIVWVDSKVGCVECNPTSNLRIGHLERYENLPLYRFAKISGVVRRQLNATVSTDDKGLFGTSLSRELSLVAVALMKQRYGDNRRRWGDATIEKYVRRLSEAGVRCRFR